jgi:hypothetical protein
MGNSLNKWYEQFGIVGVASDCLIIVLGILLGKMLFPSASGWNLVLVVIMVQLAHDILFYFLIVKPLPTGTNKMIDSYIFDYSFDGVFHECPYNDLTEMFNVEEIIKSL